MSASESSTLHPNTPIPTAQPSTNSTAPLLGEGFQETTVPKVTESKDVEEDEGTKSGKRRLFGFGKRKKDDDRCKTSTTDEPVPEIVATNANAPIAQSTVQQLSQKSPVRSDRHPYQHAVSPKRNLYSSSPRIVSPAGSQIFERDVQEGAVPVPNSPAIPSHILSENKIPPVLDASSEAITNKEIDPDTVEIVMHSSHLPAAVTVTGIGSSELRGENWADDLIAHPDKDDAASNYGALDSADVRRLSFISFSDIVQSEHLEHAGSKDPIYIAGLNSLSSGGYRSPSPIRSPVSSQGLDSSPPTSKSASVKGVELSPKAKALGSPSRSHVPGGHQELTIETMSQAVQRTGSGDIGGIRSQPLSPVSPDGLSDQSFH